MIIKSESVGSQSWQTRSFRSFKIAFKETLIPRAVGFTKSCSSSQAFAASLNRSYRFV